MSMRATPLRAKRRGGRPSKAQAAEKDAKLIEAAAALFLEQGFGATSVEEIARRAGISKRTFYTRYADKGALFGAVVHGLVNRLRPADDAPLFEGASLEEILVKLGRTILRAATSPRALALQRVIYAEAARFPELAAALEREGARREAVNRIAALLTRESQREPLALDDPAFAAEQFMQMLTSIPQRRALGLGEKMTAEELEAWSAKVVRLFLNGCRRR